MNMREKMIEEIKAEIESKADTSQTEFSSTILEQTVSALVDAFLGYQRDNFPNEREAAKSFVSKLQSIVK